jgi:hypothetical protein
MRYSDSVAGVGYTTPEKNTSSRTLIWSGEWTWGAVYMTRRLANEYQVPICFSFSYLCLFVCLLLLLLLLLLFIISFIM